MARHFPDFLSAYAEYSQDGFVPNHFHEWIGLSLLSGVLERKVSLKQDLIHYFPNLYVMLVSHPKQGKSTAIERGVDLLEEIKKNHNPNFRIIPTRVTDAAFIQMMEVTDRFPLPNNPNIMIPQSAGYFYASEASASALQNLYGNFVSSLTAFYDCPRWYRDKTKGNPIMIEIENACMNILSGATFNFLKELVNESSIDGGFASRVLYVVNSERKIRQGKWEKGAVETLHLKQKLIEDLVHINKLVGPVQASPEWRARYEEWQPKFDQYIIDLNSTALESVMARKDMNVIKVSILLSVSEGDSLILTGDHFDRALKLVDAVYANAPMILSMAAIADKQSQKGTTQFIAQAIKKKGGKMSRYQLQALALSHGNDLDKVAKTIDFMIGAKWLRSCDDGIFELLIEPDEYL